MNKIITWIANDGSRFVDQEECHAYEVNLFLNKYKDVSIEFFDMDWQKMDLRQTIKDYLTNNTLLDDNLSYIVIKEGRQKRVLEFMDKLFETYFSESEHPISYLWRDELEDIQEKTILAYDENDMRWFNLTLRCREDLATIKALLH